jgi:hypothetical protein
MIHREITSLIRDALKAAKQKQPTLSADPADYYLFNFTVGWEGLGHWEAECELSQLSLLVTPAMKGDARSAQSNSQRRLRPDRSHRALDMKTLRERFAQPSPGHGPAP